MVAVMAKRQNYIDELSDWVKKQQRVTQRGRNIAGFLGCREDVQTALAASFPAKTVWRHLHATGRIGFGYYTFLRYLRQFATPPAGTESSIQPVHAGSTPLGKPSADMPGFNYNPIPKKEDLI